MPPLPATGLAPSGGAPSAARLGARRIVFFALVTATMLPAVAAVATAFLKNGLTAIEIAMLLL